MNLNIVVLAIVAMLLCVLAPGGVECAEDKPVKCFTDNDCVKAGKTNSYCRKQKKVVKLHHSECEPKRSKYLIIIIISKK